MLVYMAIILDYIIQDQVCEFKEDVRITNGIEPGARVTMYNSSLTVDGDIDNAEIILVETRENHLFSFNIFHSFLMSMTVGGNVINGTKITSGSSSVYIKGSTENSTVSTKSGNVELSSNVENSDIKTMSGNVLADELVFNSFLSSMSGIIKVSATCINSRLENVAGKILVSRAENNSQINTTAGDIQVDSSDDTVSIKSVVGSISLGGCMPAALKT